MLSLLRRWITWQVLMLTGGVFMFILVLWTNAEAQRRHLEQAQHRDEAVSALIRKLDRLIERCRCEP